MNVRERELGDGALISIGTAIPVEHLLEENYDGVKNIHMNVRTLARNFLGSYVDFTVFNYRDLYEVFVEDTTNMINILHEYNVVLYAMDSNRLALTFPFANIKEPATPKQKLHLEYETKLAEHLITKMPVKIFKHRIKPEFDESLLLSSFALDLFSFPEFRKLTLIESHTGKIVPRIEWFSKLHKDDKWKHCPFNLLFLQILGDRSNQFKNLGAKWSKPLLELSIERKWTPLTTKDKMMFDIKRLKDTYLAEHLIQMLTVKLR